MLRQRLYRHPPFDARGDTLSAIEYIDLPLVILVMGSSAHDSKQLLPLLNAVSGLCVPHRVRRYAAQTPCGNLTMEWRYAKGWTSPLSLVGLSVITSKSDLGNAAGLSIERMPGSTHSVGSKPHTLCGDIHQAFLTLGYARICWRSTGES